MEGQSQRLCQSSDDLDVTKETVGELYGLKRIYVWVYRKQDFQKYDVWAWEVDKELTDLRNGETFDQARERCWKGLQFK
jgi:hypothetical protein